MPKLTIDKREIEVAAGTKVIVAAERLGIVIPRFCYHPALGSVGACRACAVAFLEGPVKGIQMSCMVNAMDGMVVSTTDPEAVDFRRHVIEWLMLHHPHDCPVCDEGGHCLLQDTTIAGGHGLRRYKGTKRTHRDQYLGPLVQHEMNRCIQCYRCARYYQEYTGYRDLGVMGIGSRVYFGRSVPGQLESPFAGNLIDICPTGVYTDKPSRYMGRRWDFQRAPSVCLHCSLGCNVTVSARYRQVVRLEARYNREVNGYFICDRGRYGYAYTNAPDRPRQALAAGRITAMDEAVEHGRSRLRETMARSGSQSVAVIASSRSSLETLATVKQVCRLHPWRGPAVTQTRREAANLQTAVAQLKPEFAVSLGAITAADQVVVLGADPLNESPMLALSLRQAQRQGGQVTVIDPRPVSLPLPFDHQAVHPSRLPAVMDRIITLLGHRLKSTAPPATAIAEPDMAWAEALVRQLAASRRAVIVCGTDITTPDEIGMAAAMAKALRQLDTEAKLFYTLMGANAFTAALTESPDPSIESILEQIESGSVRALLVVEQDLWQCYPDRVRLQAALDRLDLLIVMDHVASPILDRADCVIPTQTLYEAGGHWINQEGRLQNAQAVLKAGEPIAISGQGNHPPRHLSPRISGTEAMTARAAITALVRPEDRPQAEEFDRAMEAAVDAFHPVIISLDPRHIGRQVDSDAVGGTNPVSQTSSRAAAADAGRDTITLLMVDWTLGTEALSSQAVALTESEQNPAARMHPRELEAMGLAHGQTIAITTDKGRIALPLLADDRMAGGVLLIPRHHQLDWQVLGATRLEMDRDRISAGT